MPTTYTPLRFPGGKSKLFPLVDAILSKNDMLGCTYAEVFCGGAGLAIKLLLTSRVSRIVLNDADPAVYSTWDTIVHHPDELCRFIESVPLSIDEWKSQRDIYRHERVPSLELGKAAFYLNRTNRSGILSGGVIGGVGQEGKYRIDARFNRANLAAKVRRIARCAKSIELWNLDAIDFVKQVAPALGNDSLIYLDPPYVKKGPVLYESCYTENDHCALAASIRSYPGRWIVTYDMDPLVDELYRYEEGWPITVDEISVGYSAARNRRVAKERLVLSPGLVMDTVSIG